MMVTKKRCLIIIQKKDNGLPLCESEETSLDSKSEKSMSIVVILEGIEIVFLFSHVSFLNLVTYIFHLLRLSSSLHNFFFTDYVCNQADLDIIEPIKKIPYKPRKEQVVLIDDALIDRMNMECLFQSNAFLNDQVIAFLNDQFIALFLTL
jgi:hypothetical protein